MQTLSTARVNHLHAPCRAVFKQRLAWVTSLLTVPHGRRDEALAAVVASTVQSDGKPAISAERLRKLRDAYRRHGELALIDHTLCGGTCGVSTCRHTARKDTLPQPVIEEWQARIFNHKTPQHGAETNNMKVAWRSIIADLVSGQPLKGAGTWRDVWLRQHPNAAIPPVCPYSERKPPHGWTYGNFLNHKPTRAVIDLAQKGVAAMLTHLPQVRMDWSELMPQQWLVVDDKRIDVKVHGTFEGKRQFGELWSLMIMDGATRRILWCQLHPRWTRADGTTTGITLRDVQHCFAHFFGGFGLWTGGQTIIKAENASAAISKDFEDVLTRMSGGRIVVERSGLFAHRGLIGGYDEHGGNPRGKAILESFFGRRWDIEFGAVRSQIGGDYTRKHGAQYALEDRANAWLRKMGDMLSDEQAQIVLDMESLNSVRPLILQTLNRLENRTDHRLQGFTKQHLFRWSDGSEKWLPLTTPALLNLPDAARNAVLAQPGCYLEQMESPVMRWNRLRNPADYAAIDQAAFIDLYMDAASAEYCGNGTLTAKFRGGIEHEFRGLQHTLQPGEKATLRFDLDMPEAGCWIYDSRGSYAGRMDYAHRSLVGDEEAITRQLADRSRELGKNLSEFRRVAQPRTAMLDGIAEVNERLSVLSTVRAETGQQLPAQASSRQLQTMVERDLAEQAAKRAQRAKSEADDMELLLRAHLTTSAA